MSKSIEKQNDQTDGANGHHRASFVVQMDVATQTVETDKPDRKSGKKDTDIISDTSDTYDCTALFAFLNEKGFSDYELVELQNSLTLLHHDSTYQRTLRNNNIKKSFSLDNIQRVIYTAEQKRKVGEINRIFLLKQVPSAKVLDFIHSVKGYEKISKSMVHRFMAIPEDAEGLTKRSGRPTSDEFEVEVLDEAVRLVYQHEIAESSDNISDKANPLSPNCLVREAAITVHDRFYPKRVVVDLSHNVLATSSSGYNSSSAALTVDDDGETMEQKWKTHPLTCKLKFSNQWVLKMLARNDIENWDVASVVAAEHDNGRKVRGVTVSCEEMCGRVQRTWRSVFTSSRQAAKRHKSGSESMLMSGVAIFRSSGELLRGVGGSSGAAKESADDDEFEGEDDSDESDP